MDNRKIFLDLIQRRLSYLKAEVSLANSLNLTDINIYAENFYRDLLNLMGYTFNNTNFNIQNCAHVDLIDTKNKVAIQVTSQNDSEKIKEAIYGFYKDPEHKYYKLKLLLLSKDAKDYKTKFGKNFDHKKDVIDINRLFAEINNKEFEDIQKIATFLDTQILTERKQTESSEVETIMALINYLSQNKNRVILDAEIIVDPEKKIEKRFKVYSSYLREQYQNLFCSYNQALMIATEKIDSVNAIIISEYLRDESDILLIKENNDPKLALSSLVELFYSKLSINGLKFDKQAIKFYLLDELIKCNVFPNK